MEKGNSNVLIIYTGGTIGMIKDAGTGALKVFDFEHLTSHIPELGRLSIHLDSTSIQEPIDSTEMNPECWAEIAQTIFDNYAKYDGFVVLHGSDTMAYTASALSFMLEHLDKPVVLTGSQLPIGTIRTDGKENFITSIEIAAAKDENGQSMLREVAIYFEYSLYRGNRTSKVSASLFEAFRSPNYPELAVAGVDINYRLPVYEPKQKELQLFTELNNQVALMKVFPGFNMDLYESLFQVDRVKGIVIESFGSGNLPRNERFVETIRQYIHTGGIVLNITQCSTGSVNQGKYETSSFLEELGVVGGADLTTEAAITKLMYLIGKYPDISSRIRALKKSLVGEMTVN
ncbi:MAG: asparaginase [Bacteroidetes bacterium]|nr:MAG: asparaginase [Bacteroidota bacterium]